jgi:hypothetical protein
MTQVVNCEMENCTHNFDGLCGAPLIDLVIKRVQSKLLGCEQYEVRGADHEV